MLLPDMTIRQSGMREMLLDTGMTVRIVLNTVRLLHIHRM